MEKSQFLVGVLHAMQAAIGAFSVQNKKSNNDNNNQPDKAEHLSPLVTSYTSNPSFYDHEETLSKERERKSQITSFHITLVSKGGLSGILDVKKSILIFLFFIHSGH